MCKAVCTYCADGLVPSETAQCGVRSVSLHGGRAALNFSYRDMREGGMHT